MDPFGVTCDPQAYVPRPATEAVLAELEQALLSGRRVCALSGPAGLGKTLVLRVLEERLAGRAQCVWLPYAALGTEELARWVLGLLGRDPMAASDPVAALVDHARQGALLGRPLVLLLDDASALPVEAARRWVELCQETRGALRLVVVPVDDGRAGRVIGALGEDVVRTRLNAPMTPQETRAYVKGRLDYGQAGPVLRERFSPILVAWLYRESGGNPRRLQALATWILHRGDAVPGTTSPPSEDDAWLDLGSGVADGEGDAPPLELDEPLDAPEAPDASRARVAVPAVDGADTLDPRSHGSVDNPTPEG